MDAEAKRDEASRAAVDSDPYACGVIHALASDFPDLRDPVVAGIVKKAVYVNARGLNRVGIEVIVDDPFSANWRLIPAPHDRRRVHLVCWRRNRTDADSERWARLNAALDALGTDDDSTGEG
jgi:hypothetical protein